MANIKKLRDEVESKLTFARALHLTGTHEENQQAADAAEVAKKALSDGIVAGADECPDCGEQPHGLVQEVMVRKKLTPVYEVGCLGCRDHRAQGFTPELAVADWNAGPEAWLAPSTGPGVKGAEELSSQKSA